MYELFSRRPVRFTGEYEYPQLWYLRREYRDQINEITAYYQEYPKYLGSPFLIADILFHIPERRDLDDHSYMLYVEDASKGVARRFGLTSSDYTGRVFENGVTMGEEFDEILLSNPEHFETDRLVENWIRLRPLTYLYHTRFDMGMPIPNNNIPGSGYAVTTLNIPMLCLQYRYWRRMQEHSIEQRESIYRFVSKFVLPGALYSYLDIAFFNRLSRIAKGIGNSKFPNPHPFYLTNLTSRVDHVCELILKDQDRRSEDIEQVAWTTPMIICDRLTDIMQLPKAPVTRHNEWAYYIARMPYIRYILTTGVKNHRGDKSYLNDIHESIIDAHYDRIFNNVGRADVIKRFREGLNEMMDLMETLGYTWSF